MPPSPSMKPPPPAGPGPQSPRAWRVPLLACHYLALLVLVSVTAVMYLAMQPHLQNQLHSGAAGAGGAYHYQSTALGGALIRGARSLPERYGQECNGGPDLALAAAGGRGAGAGRGLGSDGGGMCRKGFQVLTIDTGRRGNVMGFFCRYSTTSEAPRLVACLPA
jgi:hypothetical protein